MNSKRQSKRKLSHKVQILVCRLTLVNMMLITSLMFTLHRLAFEKEITGAPNDDIVQNHLT